MLFLLFRGGHCARRLKHMIYQPRFWLNKQGTIVVESHCRLGAAALTGRALQFIGNGAGMQEARDQAQKELAEFRERAIMEADQLQNDIRVLQQELSQMASGMAQRLHQPWNRAVHHRET